MSYQLHPVFHGAANQAGQYEEAPRESVFVYGLTDSGQELLSAGDVGLKYATSSFERSEV
jgi:hypothetical protein